MYKSTKFKYIIEKGNNSQLIREAMENRKDWVEIPNISTLFNFKWQSSSEGIRFEDLHSFGSSKQIVNHLKHHKAISCK